MLHAMMYYSAVYSNSFSIIVAVFDEFFWNAWLLPCCFMMHEYWTRTITLIFGFRFDFTLYLDDSWFVCISNSHVLSWVRVLSMNLWIAVQICIRKVTDRIGKWIYRYQIKDIYKLSDSVPSMFLVPLHLLPRGSTHTGTHFSFIWLCSKLQHCIVLATTSRYGCSGRGLLHRKT